MTFEQIVYIEQTVSDFEDRCISYNHCVDSIRRYLNTSIEKAQYYVAEMIR